MPTRRLPRTNPERDSALTNCKAKMDATAAAELPFSAAKAAKLATDQPAYHTLIVNANLAKSKQTSLSATLNPLRHAARLWVSHGYQALINACIREEFPNSVKNLYGLTLDAKGGPDLSSDSDINQAAITYNDGETARTASGGDPISFPSLANINLNIDAYRTAQQEQSNSKSAYDTAQENIAAANPNIDLLILQLWNSIEAEYDTGDKPSMRRKAREWGVVYVPNAGEAPSADDFSVVGKITDSATGLPLDLVTVTLSSTTVTETYVTEADGMFFLPPVPAGTYELEATLANYTPNKVTITVVEGEVQEVNLALEPIVLP